ncbi:MAG: PilZ domain-containing protein, partial [Desulfofustis sp.]
MLMLSEVSADVSGRRSHRRRKHPRAGVDWPVTVITDKATYHGKTVNISRGGALIHLTHALDPGDHVRLAIEIPECQDAILAKAEIVRVFPLKRGLEHQFTHGIAFKFTEITQENLKFFSGNLSSEWKEDFSELDRYPQTELPQQTKSPKSSDNHTHYAIWILAVILLIPICYLAFVSAEQKADNQQMADQLEKRLMIIEEQIESSNDSND